MSYFANHCETVLSASAAPKRTTREAKSEGSGYRYDRNNKSVLISQNSQQGHTHEDKTSIIVNERPKRNFDSISERIQTGQQRTESIFGNGLLPTFTCIRLSKATMLKIITGIIVTVGFATGIAFAFKDSYIKRWTPGASDVSGESVTEQNKNPFDLFAINLNRPFTNPPNLLTLKPQTKPISTSPNVQSAKPSNNPNVNSPTIPVGPSAIPSITSSTISNRPITLAPAKPPILPPHLGIPGSRFPILPGLDNSNYPSLVNQRSIPLPVKYTGDKASSNKLGGLNSYSCGRPKYFPSFRSTVKRQAPTSRLTPKGRIVGGSNVQIDDYPWQVSLWYSGSHKCGGSIIASKWILFAAHCAYMAGTGATWTVYAGEVSLRNMPTNAQKALSSNVIAHRGFNFRSLANDVALIKLDRDLIFSDSVRTLCLPPFSWKVTANMSCELAGWGSETNFGIRSNHLQAVNISTLDRDTCNADPIVLGGVTEYMFCAGKFDGSVNFCSGDSGSPLTCKSTSEGRFFQMGIVSWNLKCDLKPGVYTNIPLYTSWIEEQMLEN